jgi:hypothetical protein
MTLTRIFAGAIAALLISSAETRGQTTQIKTEYLMTLYAPLDPAQQIDSSAVIRNVGSGGWVKGPKINGTLILQRDHQPFEGSCRSYGKGRDNDRGGPVLHHGTHDANFISQVLVAESRSVRGQDGRGKGR